MTLKEVRDSYGRYLQGGGNAPEFMAAFINAANYARLRVNNGLRLSVSEYTSFNDDIEFTNLEVEPFRIAILGALQTRGFANDELGDIEAQFRLSLGRAMIPES